MATKSMGYDNPAYLAVNTNDTDITGSAGAGTKFVAFTSMICKSATLKPVTASTSADTVSFVQISGTTTTSSVLATFGSAAGTFTNIPFAAPQPILAQGDTYYFLKGTDATSTIACSLERVVQPLANVTV